MPGQDLSNYLEGKLIEHILRNVPYAAPGTVYLGLFTASPGEAGSLVNEIATAEYHRQPVVFGAPTDGVCLNTANIQYAPAASDWGSITYLALFDASTGGNMLWYGPASLAITIATTDIYRVNAGSLAVGIG